VPREFLKALHCAPQQERGIGLSDERLEERLDKLRELRIPAEPGLCQIEGVKLAVEKIKRWVSVVGRPIELVIEEGLCSLLSFDYFKPAGLHAFFAF
jgi:hypothetical protein